MRLRLPERVRERILRRLGSSTRQRLARGAFWGGLAYATTRGVSILVSFGLARLLGREGFGEYGILNSTVAMIGGMAGLGIGTTVVKHIAEFKVSDPNRAGRILALSSGITWISSFLYAAGFIVLAPWIAERALAAPGLAPLLRISAFTVAFGVINSVQTCSLTGCEAFRTNMQVGVACSLLQSGLVLCGAWGWGIEGAIWALAVSMLLTVLATRLCVQREWRHYGLRLRWQEACREWRVLFDFSLPTFLSGISVGPVLWGCSAMLAHRPNGYVELGIYNAANQWQQAIQFLPSLMGTALLPVMADKCGQGDWPGSFSVMWKMVKITAALVFSGALAVSLASSWIMHGYGEGFASGHWTLVLSVAAAAFCAVLNPVGNLIAASGRMWAGFWLNAGWGIAMLLASWGMVCWGAEGLAGARLMAYMCHAVWTFGFVFYLKRRVRPKSISSSGT